MKVHSAIMKTLMKKGELLFFDIRTKKCNDEIAIRNALMKYNTSTNNEQFQSYF